MANSATVKPVPTARLMSAGDVDDVSRFISDLSATIADSGIWIDRAEITILAGTEDGPGEELGTVYVYTRPNQDVDIAFKPVVYGL